MYVCVQFNHGKQYNIEIELDQIAWVQIAAPLSFSHVILSKLLKLCVTHFPHLYGRGSNST